MEIGPDEVVYGLVGMGNVTIELRLVNAFGGEAERARLEIAGLRLEPVEVDGSTVEPAGRAGFESGQLKSTGAEAVAQEFGRLVSRPSSAGLGLTHVHESFEERAGGE